MFAAILLAAGLSSAGVGTFFTLPPSLPADVSSHETPGSDPSDGAGWYVDEYETVGGFSPWSVTYNGRDRGHALGEPFQDASGAWVVTNILGFSAWHTQRLVWSPAETIAAGDDALELSWSIHRSGYKTQWDADRYSYSADDHVYTARRTVLEPERRPTGRKVPRAARLTPGVCSSVCATFDGLYERLYYASQGQSNVWNVAEYGPRTAREFDFHAPEWGGVWVCEPSDRNVTSRRLLEYDNIAACADYMRGGLMSVDEAPVFRPGWLRDSSMSDGLLWWSTTASVIPGDIVPAFGWTTDPTRALRDRWSKCGRSFADLARDDCWGDHDRYELPGDRLMGRVGFGQSGYDTSACRSSSTNLTFAGMIETVYPSADGMSATNATRRLYSHRLCGMNQALGLMDRTWHVPEIVYPTIGTNVSYRSWREYRGTLPVDVSPSSGSASFGDLSWGESSDGDRRSYGPGVSSGQAMHYRMSGTSTGSELSCICTGLPSAVFDLQAVAALLPSGLTRGVATLNMFDAVYRDGVVTLSFYVSTDDADRGHDSYERSVTVAIPATNVTADVVLRYERAYGYRHTVGTPYLGHTQPGFEAWQTGRVKESRVGSVTGVIVRHAEAALEEMGARSGDEYAYKSAETSYGTRAGLSSEIARAAADGAARFGDMIGVNPADWQSVIPIDADDVLRVRDSVRPLSAVLSFGQRVQSVSVFLEFGPGGVTVKDVAAWYADGNVDYQAKLPISIGSLEMSVSFAKDSARQVERTPASADVKVGALTRVDWSWRCLSRQDD